MPPFMSCRAPARWHRPCIEDEVQEATMPEQATLRRAQDKLRHHRSPSTAAGEFVREEMHHIREGKHGAKSAKQAVAIGLSKARRAGVPIPDKGRSSSGTKRRKSARAT